MDRIHRFLKSFLFIALALPSSYILSQPAVDGFLKGKSNLDVALGATYEGFSQYYQQLNETTPISRTSMAVSAFGCMGITNWLDAQVNIPYISTSGDLSNLQDFSGYLKAAVINKYFENGSNVRFMLVGGSSFPMSNYETEDVNSIGQQAKAMDGRAVIQYTAPNGIFIMAQGGYTNREDPVPSSNSMAFKLGMAKAEYYIDLWYDQQMADGGNDYADYKNDISQNGITDVTFTSFGVSYGKAGITYYKPLKNKSGLAAGASYVLWGRNVGQAFGISLAYIKLFSFSGS